MILARWLALVSIGSFCWLASGAASAGALVEFPTLPGQTPVDLNGYLARPDTGLAAELGSPSNGGGPFPAVVVLHGCIGITGHFTGIADRLSSWGYVALAVDSLGPRGISSRCGSGGIEQAFDAYAALRYLSQVYSVDPARVAVLGESMGGFAVLYAELCRLLSASH
jgi:dienelactone hydrolase